VPQHRVEPVRHALLPSLDSAQRCASAASAARHQARPAGSHTYTHRHTHARAQAHTHRHTRTQTHSYTYAHCPRKNNESRDGYDRHATPTLPSAWVRVKPSGREFLRVRYSVVPDAFVRITGSAIDMASIAGKHHPSPRVGSTNASDAAYSQRNSSLESSRWTTSICTALQRRTSRSHSLQTQMPRCATDRRKLFQRRAALCSRDFQPLNNVLVPSFPVWFERTETQHYVVAFRKLIPVRLQQQVPSFPPFPLEH
jgi:hypothetical protein